MCWRPRVSSLAILIPSTFFNAYFTFTKREPSAYLSTYQSTYIIYIHTIYIYQYICLSTSLSVCLLYVRYFSFQPVLHNWSNKGHGMCYPLCGMVHIKEPLLLIGQSSLCGGNGFPFSLSEWSLTICLTPYNRK